MKYEFKPLCAATYDDDLGSDWIPILRSDKDEAAPRGLHITFLPPFANWESRAIGTLKCGDVYQFTSDGLFNPKAGESTLDVIMRREVEEKPKPREIRGVAYVSEFGEVVTVSPDYIDGEAKNCKAVRCTITLHEPA
jgi:hypothetical protein